VKIQFYLPRTTQDETLRNAVAIHKSKNWKKIAEHVKDRTDVQCLHRWQKVLNPELVKGPWTKEVIFCELSPFIVIMQKKKKKNHSYNTL
jgi:Myb-like DNA-binding domain